MNIFVRFMAIIILVILLPFLLFLMIVIRLESKGNPIFRVNRVGKGGKLFTIYKLRTMRKGKVPIHICSPIELKQYDYHRITRVGHILREYHLDELPQLWNIFRNEMVFVGPRPVGIGIANKKISVIYNGVDTDLFTPAFESLSVLPQDFAQEGSFVIGTIGRLERVKDQVTLTKAFIRLLEMRPTLRNTIRLVIIGEGALRTEIEAMLERADASQLAWLPGFRDDTNKLFKSFSIFVLPSRREGISNTILEAMASGLPVIATRVGGNAEIVKENTTGQLVPSDDPDAIATALLRYITEPGLIEAHGQVARDSAKHHFSLKVMVNNYSQIYKSI